MEEAELSDRRGLNPVDDGATEEAAEIEMPRLLEQWPAVPKLERLLSRQLEDPP